MSLVCPTDLQSNSESKPVGPPTAVDEEIFVNFRQNVCVGLSDLGKCCRGDGLYISMMTAVSLEPYQTNRAESCTRYHNEKCTECSALNKMASHILQEGIVKVCDLYKRQFPSHKYQSDKAVRRLMQLPVVIFKQEFLFVTAYRPMLDYRKMDWSTKLLPGKEIEKLDDHSKTRQVQEAMARAEDIRQSTMEFAQLEKTALLQSLGISDVNSSESDTSGSGNESEYLETDSEDSMCESGDETNCIVPKDKVENDLHLPQPSNIPDEIRFDLPNMLLI